MTVKTKKVVEHRWFPSTTDCGLLGGIVAPNKEAAESWGTCELFSDRQDFKLVRVRMEYEIPIATKRKSR